MGPAMSCSCEYMLAYLENFLILNNCIRSRKADSNEIDVLNSLNRSISTPFDINSAEHMALLARLWVAGHKAVAPNVEPPIFEHKSSFWKVMGFQQLDPVSDIRGGGLLAVEQLAYFLEKYPEFAKSMLDAGNKDGEEKEPVKDYDSYPWAAAGINITRMLCVLFDVITPVGGAGPFQESRKQFWPCAASRDRFDQLFCFTFQTLHRNWVEMGATYMQFNVVLENTKLELRALLEKESSRGFQNCHAVPLDGAVSYWPQQQGTNLEDIDHDEGMCPWQLTSTVLGDRRRGMPDSEEEHDLIGMRELLVTVSKQDRADSRHAGPFHDNCLEAAAWHAKGHAKGPPTKMIISEHSGNCHNSSDGHGGTMPVSTSGTSSSTVRRRTTKGFTSFE